MKRKCSYISTPSPFFLVELAQLVQFVRLNVGKAQSMSWLKPIFLDAFRCFWFGISPMVFIPKYIILLIILERTRIPLIGVVVLLNCDFHSEILSLILVP